MEFSDKLKEFSKRIETLQEGIQTEEATKTSLIMPFFNLLGYDVFNPLEFCPEFTADVGIKKGEKIDYAILDEGHPLILVECKNRTEQLDKHGSQLFRYFGTSKSRFAILTNGIIYRFYTDLEEQNKMDLSPFLEIDLLNMKEHQIVELKKFCKDSFDTDKIFSTASELKYTNLVKGYLSSEFDNPSDDFVKCILSHVYEGQKTQKIIDKYKPVIKKSFSSYITDIVNQKISSALTSDEQPSVSSSDQELEKESKIITTQEELQSFYIVRGILAGVSDISDITHRDTESYFGILFQDNNRKPICRLNFDKKQKQIMIPDENKNFSRYYIDTLNDLYKYKDLLIEVVTRYLYLEK